MIDLAAGPGRGQKQGKDPSNVRTYVWSLCVVRRSVSEDVKRSPRVQLGGGKERIGTGHGRTRRKALLSFAEEKQGG